MAKSYPVDSTFSIAAVDLSNLEIGVAISTCRPAVGNRCIVALSGVGAIATQARTNPYLKLEILNRLLNGDKPEQILHTLSFQDAGFDHRQVSIVDFRGNVATFTGPLCQPYAAGRVEHGVAAIGNILAGPEVLSAMIDSFKQNHGLRLGPRLLRALQAGEKAGGDSRGRQSAAIVVSKIGWYPYIDLRVDDSQDPCNELGRLLGVVLSEIEREKSEFPHLGMRTLTMGCTGVDVLHVAFMLRHLGYDVGARLWLEFKEPLAKSVKQFQMNNNLQSTGVLDKETLDKLQNEFLRDWREKQRD